MKKGAVPYVGSLNKRSHAGSMEAFTTAEDVGSAAKTQPTLKMIETERSNDNSSTNISYVPGSYSSHQRADASQFMLAKATKK